MIDPVMLDDLLEDSEAYLMEPRDVFDQAIVGIAEVGTYVAVYDEDRVLALLRQVHGMSEDEAREFFDFNVNIGGNGAPIFLDPLLSAGDRQ